MVSKKRVADFAAYERQFPAEVRQMLKRVRSAIKQALPEAIETINYNIPAFRLHGRIIAYFAAFKGHIGLYPPMCDTAALKRAAAPYMGPKGNLQFRFDKPIPYAFIARIVRARAARAAKLDNARPSLRLTKLKGQHHE